VLCVHQQCLLETRGGFWFLSHHQVTTAGKHDIPLKAREQISGDSAR
jgi:hypothetical protein